MMELLKNVVKNKINVKIITRPQTDFKEKGKENIKEMHDYINNEGMNIVLKSNTHQKFVEINENYLMNNREIII